MAGKLIFSRAPLHNTRKHVVVDHAGLVGLPMSKKVEVSGLSFPSRERS